MKPIPEMRTTPLYSDDDITMGAWYGLIVWVATQKEITDAFKRDTGFNLPGLLSSSGINKMIDEATGFDKAVIVDWADWVTEHLWGVEGGDV